MNTKNRNWFLYTLKKAKDNLNLPNFVEVEEPLIFIEKVLAKDTLVVRWWDGEEKTQKEFPSTIPVSLISEGLGINPMFANVWFLGSLEEFKKHHYYNEGCHLADYEGSSFIVMGEMEKLRFILGVCPIVGKERKLFIPKLYKNPKLSWS